MSQINDSVEHGLTLVDFTTRSSSDHQQTQTKQCKLLTTEQLKIPASVSVNQRSLSLQHEAAVKPSCTCTCTLLTHVVSGLSSGTVNNTDLEHYNFRNNEAFARGCVCVCLCMCVHTHTVLLCLIISQSEPTCWLTLTHRQSHIVAL